MLVEQRQNNRKILRGRAMVVMDGAAPAPARSLDIGPTGISLTMGHMVQAGQAAQVSFEMMVEGKPLILTCRSKVTHCIFSGDEVKVGFQFINPDQTVLSSIGKYMR